MIRLTLTDDARLVAHGGLGERDLMPDEIELVREALPSSPHLPLWLDLGVVAAVVGAMVFWVHGIGKGIGS